MDLAQFKSANTPTESTDTFQHENSYTLDVAVTDSIMAKAGAMVAYTGDLSFTGQASAEGGIRGFLSCPSPATSSDSEYELVVLRYAGNHNK